MSELRWRRARNLSYGELVLPAVAPFPVPFKPFVIAREVL